jgi:uncharacterized protein
MPTPAPIDAHLVHPPVPWWRVGVMWLVVGGLGVVVVASFALLATAVRHADGVQPHAGVRSTVPNTPSSPAMQARNHSATPAK